MNILKILCIKCENPSEKDILLSINTKESRNSIRIKKTKNTYNEVISNNSTNNLEIIDYPYMTNSKDNLSKVTKENIFLRLQLDQKILEKENKRKNNDNSFESKSNSSIVMVNQDSYRQNKELLDKMRLNKNKNDKIKEINNNQKIIENLLYSNKTTEMSNCNIEKYSKKIKNSQKETNNPIKIVNKNKNKRKNKCLINNNKKFNDSENNLNMKFISTNNSTRNPQKKSIKIKKISSKKSFFNDSQVTKSYKQSSLNIKTFESNLAANLVKYKSNASKIVKNQNQKLNYSYLLLNNDSSKNHISSKYA